MNFYTPSCISQREQWLFYGKRGAVSKYCTRRTELLLTRNTTAPQKKLGLRLKCQKLCLNSAYPSKSIMLQ